MSRIISEIVPACQGEVYEPARRMTEAEYRWSASVLIAYLFGQLGVPYTSIIPVDSPGGKLLLENWNPPEAHH